MKKSLVRTAAISVGLATIISLSSVAPSFAKGNEHGNSHSNNGSSQSQTKGHGQKGRGAQHSQQGASNNNVASVTVPFTVTNVPAIYSDARSISRVVLFKVVVLPADATSAPATPSALDKKAGKNLASFNGTVAPTLANGTLSGSIAIKAAKVAGATNLAIYPIVRADQKTGLAAQSGTPVFVTRNTAADGTVTLSNQSGDLTLDLSQNTGTVKVPQTATVVVPDDGKAYQLVITDSEGRVVRVLAVTGVGSVTVNLPQLKPGAYSVDLVAKASTSGFTIGSDGSLTGALNVG